jgi:hypothetical protein
VTIGADGIAVYPWSHGDVLVASALNAAIAQGNISNGGTVTEPLIVTATGATTPRSVQDRFAEVINVKDYGAKGDGTTDDTTAIQAAINAALALARPVKVYLPSGNYHISSQLSVTTAAAQGIAFAGDGASFTTITQTANQSGLIINLTNSGGTPVAGAISVKGIAFAITGTTGTSSAAQALAVSTTAGPGVIAPPVIIEDVTLVSTSSTQFWGVGIQLIQIPAGLFVSRLNSMYPGSFGTHLVIQGNPSSPITAAGHPTTTAGIRDCTLVNGSVGISLGDYLQGIHFDNIQCVNAPTAVNCIMTQAAPGASGEFQFDNSYFYGLVVFTSTAAGVLNWLKFTNVAFDGAILNVPANSYLVTFDNVRNVQIANCLFSGQSTGHQINGLHITASAGTTTEMITATACTFEDFQATGCVAVTIGPNVGNALFNGSYFARNTTNVVNNGTNTQFTNTWEEGGVFHLAGCSAVAGSAVHLTAPTTVEGGITFTGPVAISSAPGIQYSGLGAGSNQIGFNWNGSAIVGWVDGANEGAVSGGLPLAGGTVTGALTVAGSITGNTNLVCGSGTVASSPTDLSKQLNIFGNSYGISVTANTLNLVANGAASLQVTNGGAQVNGAITVNAAGPTITSGAAVPASTQPIGSLYMRTGGAAGARLYVSAGGGTWAAVAGV